MHNGIAASARTLRYLKLDLSEERWLSQRSSRAGGVGYDCVRGVESGGGELWGDHRLKPRKGEVG